MSQRTGDRSRFHRLRTKRRKMRITRREAKAKLLSAKKA